MSPIRHADRPCCVCRKAPREISSYCRPCSRKRNRDWYARTSTRRPKKRKRWDQLGLAIGLTAAYQSGYRHGTADRALALSAQQKAAREAEAATRESLLVYGSYEARRLT